MITLKIKAIIALLSLVLILPVFSQPFNGNSITFENTLSAVVTGEDGLILRTTNGGTSWTALNSGITNVLKRSAYYTNGSNINVHLVAAENGVILRSTNNGAAWSNKFPGTLEDINDIFILTPAITFACGNGGTLFFSTDLGDSWSSVSTGSSSNFNRVLFFQYSTRTETTYKGLLVGDGGIALTCTGLTGSWSHASTNTTQNLNAVSYASYYVIAGGNSGAMITSYDYGATWTTASSGTSNNINGVEFIDPSTALAVGENGVILRTTNKGTNWSSITSPVTSYLTDVDFGSWSLGIATGVGGASIFSTDGGLSWNSFAADKFSAAKEDAKAFKQTNQKITSSREPDLMQNYPNPFNPSTVIGYSIPFDAQVSVKIYDMLGKEVKTLVSGQQNAGTYNVSFNAGNMSSGIYFYVLSASSGSKIMTKTMKMILSK